MPDALIIVPEITKGMKSVGSKALLKIKDSLSIIEYQVQQLKKINRKINIHIVAGFEIEKIKKTLSKSKVNIIYENEYVSTSQSRCLRLFLNSQQTDNLFIISNGVIFKNNPFDLTETDRSKVFLIDKPKSNFNIGCCETNANRINYLFYDLPTLWSECIYLTSDAIEKFCRLSNNETMDHMYLFEIVNELISNDVAFYKNYVSKKDIMKINTLKDLIKAKIFI